MRKVVLVAGASGSIGEATARVPAQARATIVLGMRRMDRLARLANKIAVRPAENSA